MQVYPGKPIYCYAAELNPFVQERLPNWNDGYYHWVRVNHKSLFTTRGQAKASVTRDIQNHNRHPAPTCSECKHLGRRPVVSDYLIHTLLVSATLVTTEAV